VRYKTPPCEVNLSSNYWIICMSLKARVTQTCCAVWAGKPLVPIKNSEYKTDYYTNLVFNYTEDLTPLCKNA
jgi:hypothetical protein